MPKDLAGEAKTAVGDLIVALLEGAGVETAFGVISIHNMPILDAIGRRGKIRFVAARGEAGAVNMADAAARVTGRLSVAVTSTGTGAGNACGALVEAMTAGTPMIHLTGQIDSPYLDRNWGFIHEAADQPGMLAAASKAFFRIARPDDVVPVMRAAVQAALTAPTGPVSVEVPIDVQKAFTSAGTLSPVLPAPMPAVADEAAVARLAARLRASERPLLWVGGGAKGAAPAVRRLADRGIGVVSSVLGRGILPEDHPMSLGAFTVAAPVLDLYAGSDLMVVAGSHLRSNETLTYSARLPAPMVRIDVDPLADGRGYGGADFVAGDAALVLGVLADALDGYRTAEGWREAVAAAREVAEADLLRQMGPYAGLRDAIAGAMPEEALWVRDITLSNSIWGNRSPVMRAPRRAVHAAGGGIGQGLPHAVGAALASGRKTVALVGDGALSLCLGEIGTLVEEQADVTLIVMNDGGYGVIRNIQDAHYGARRMYTDLRNPSFETLSAAYGLPYLRVDADTGFAPVGEAVRRRGPVMVEVDMASIGPFGVMFAGPPAKKKG